MASNFLKSLSGKFLIFFIGLMFSINTLFAITPKHDRWVFKYSQLSVAYSMFQVNDDWKKASLIVNNKKSDISWGNEYRIRYERYNSESMIFRLGFNYQFIQDQKFTFTSYALAFDLLDNLYYSKWHKIYTLISLALSPLSEIGADNETTSGMYFKGEVCIEYLYHYFANLPFKFGAGYYYQKLQSFSHTTRLNPSYMNLYGIILYGGIAYKF